MAAAALLGGLFLLLVVYVVGRAWWSIWWKPKRLERQLWKQGIRGNPYRLLHGDLKEDAKAMAEAWSKPISRTHRILPRVLPFSYRTAQRYGKMSVTWASTTPRVIVWDPEMMMSILNEKDGHIQKPPLNNPLIALLAKDSVASLEGDAWAVRRRMIMPAFHVEKLKGMVPAFFSSCDDLIKRWEKVAGVEGTCELDVWPEFQNLTGDVISKTAFGSCYEEGKKIFELQREQVSLVIEAIRSVYIPGFRFIPTTKNRRRMYLDKEIKSMLRILIQRKEDSMRKGESGNDDLLGLLLQLSSSDRQAAVTIEDVIEECKLFYFAGQETTSVWLTWTMIVLAMHPDWQQKAREEVLQVCGSNAIDMQTINHLKIVTMVLNEVFRLYPPVIIMLRHTCKGIKLGNISLPAGVDLLLPTIFIHHDPEFWGEDAEEFNPERFSQGVSKAAKDQNAFFPFGWGPRICLGQTFAIIEAKMALSMILQHFSFELSNSYAHAPHTTAITLQPQHGAQIILHKL